MKNWKKVLLVYLGQSALIGLPILGLSPEFLEESSDKIYTCVLLVISGIALIGICLLTKFVGNKVVRNLTYLVNCLLTVAYVYVLIFELLLLTSTRYPMWEDITILTNTQGEKIITQFQETSGSLHTYRNRKVFYDFGTVRISIDHHESRVFGIWNVTNVKEGITKTVKDPWI